MACIDDHYIYYHEQLENLGMQFQGFKTEMLFPFYTKNLYVQRQDSTSPCFDWGIEKQTTCPVVREKQTTSFLCIIHALSEERAAFAPALKEKSSQHVFCYSGFPFELKSQISKKRAIFPLLRRHYDEWTTFACEIGGAPQKRPNILR